MSFLNEISIYNAAADFRISTASTKQASLWTGLKNTANDLTLSNDTRLRALTALITSAELLEVAISFSYPSTTSPVNPIASGTVIHNDTVGLQGGTSTERYHSTFAQQTAWDNKASLSDITFANILGAVASNGALVAAFSAKQNLLSGNGLVRLAGSTLTYDNSVYLTNITGISSGGELQGTYPNPTLLNSAVIGKVLTGFSATNSAIVATDSIVAMAGKAQGQINALSALAANSITALTGDISAAGPGSVAATISNNAVTFAKFQQIAQGFMGRSSVGTGTGVLLTPTQATALLNTFSSSLKGLVPASIVADGTKVLYDDGTWAAPPASGSGSVTNVSGAGIASLFSLSITNPSTTPALAFALINQSANRIFAGPTTGAAAAPTWRLLAVSDIPELPISQIAGLQEELDGYLPDALANGMLFIGNVSDVAVNAIVTGDLTATYVDNSGTNEAEFTIANEAVTYAKIQNVTSQTLLGRFALTDGVAQQLTLNGSDFTINSSTGVIGLVTPNSPILTTKGDILTHTGAAQARLGIGANATFFMADTAATTGNKWVAMSGDATIAVSGALTIAAGAVTLAKMANMATNSFIGRISASTGVPEILTATQATSLLNLFSSSAKGLAPVVTGAAIGDATYFLNATGTWTVPAGGGGGGTVTSASQYSIPYYSVNPTGTTVIGLAPQTTNGTYFLRANVTASAAVAPDWLGSTGSGNVVLATSPTLTTPVLGVASATSINKVAITAPATSATLTIADGSTLATSGAFSTTLTATATTTLTLPTTGTLATLSGTETFANKTLNGPKIGTAAGSGHFHMHYANSAPTGLADYITVFGDTSPTKKLGFLFETDAFESYFQFDATAASKTYTFPDLSGTVALLANAAAFTSVTVGTASSLAGDVIFQNATNATTQTFRGTNPTSSIVYLLPTTAPTVGQVLSASAPSAGVSTLSWANGTGDVTGPASSVDGNFAVFDSTTGKIIKESAGASLTAAGVAVFNTSLALGVSGPAGTTGQLIFRNSANAFTTTIQASTSASANASYTWPQAPGTAGQILSTDVSGNLSWTAAGTGDMVLATPGQVVTGTKIFGSAGNVGKLILAGSTSGTTILNAAATAGSTTVTLPALTGTVALLENAQTFTGAKTFSGAVTMNAAGSFTVPQLSFSGTTNNWISFGTTGAGVPTFPARSAGTKIVFSQTLSGSFVDFAAGFNTGELWFSAGASGDSISFYGGTTRLGRFTGNGLTLDAVASATVPSLSLIPSSGARSSWISFGTGIGVPTTTTTRSAGTKIVFSPTFTNGVFVDFAVGFNTGELWFSAAALTDSISFYGGTTRLAFFGGVGGAALTLAGTLVGAASQDVFNTTSTTVNFAGAATALTIGATTGTATIRNATLALPNATQITVQTNKVVGVRRTGWTAPAATPSRAALPAIPTLTELSQFCAALYQDLASGVGHGLIN